MGSRLGICLMAVGLLAFGASSVRGDPTAHAARTCSYYSNQRQAQLHHDTRDADHDGIYCESLPCPCLKPRRHRRSRGGVHGESRSGACGSERWTVKTLSDSGADRINFTPESSTVDQLRQLDPPDVATHTPRQRGEFTTYRIQADLVAMKLEEDSDIHLVVADPASHRTMITEFPFGACVRSASPTRKAEMERARAALVSACGQPGQSSFRSLDGRAVLTGVAFFDLIHGQRGVAPNGIELHPVLGFRATHCARP